MSSAAAELTHPRARDADSTRQRLLDSARRRFAHDGYAAATVRDIAADAGVNVALINRYFTSKEGLFEACITRAAAQLHRPDSGELPIDQILQGILTHLPDAQAGDYPLELLLLLRSSGDERADSIRRAVMQSFAERMAAAAGLSIEGEEGEASILRAQIVLSTALGIVLMRSSTGLEPLTSATGAELQAPLGDLLRAVLFAS